MKPCRGRELVAEFYQGSHNWQKYYDQYNINVGGLVPNPKGDEMSVNHCWRFVRRVDAY